MQYMLLIYEEEAVWTSLTAEERSVSADRYREFARRMLDEGRLHAGEGLEPTSTATSVRKTGDRVVFTDGPFAETKEQLGGFFLIEARDLDQAMEDAASISTRDTEIIEIRPVMGTS